MDGYEVVYSQAWWPQNKSELNHDSVDIAVIIKQKKNLEVIIRIWGYIAVIFIVELSLVRTLYTAIVCLYSINLART